MTDLLVAKKTMERLRALRNEYVEKCPGTPWEAFTTDTDIQLAFLFYGEAMIQLKLDKKKAFGIAGISYDEPEVKNV